MFANNFARPKIGAKLKIDADGARDSSVFDSRSLFFYIRSIVAYYTHAPRVCETRPVSVGARDWLSRGSFSKGDPGCYNTAREALPLAELEATS